MADNGISPNKKNVKKGHFNSSDEVSDNNEPRSRPHSVLNLLHVNICIALLFVNYFLAQYDKFILSYFQTSVQTELSLSPTQYGLLSGYATGIVYALLAIPIAYIADYTRARVWLLSVAAIWWSLCVIFQGLALNFWQILLARIGMGIGQSCVESLSISLISDLVQWKNVFLGESVFFVGVYVGEAVSGQIATAFTKTGTSWQVALRAMGIVGLVIAVLIRLLLREPARQAALVRAAANGHFKDVEVSLGPTFGSSDSAQRVEQQPDASNERSKLQVARVELFAATAYILRMRSFWLLVLSAGFRQLGGVVFGYYMPTYLVNTYPSQTELLSRYGIVVGVVGSVTVLTGGLVTSLLWTRTKLTPVYLTAVGGMVSSVFVLLMIFSRDIAGGNEHDGVRILYGAMSAAYLTAELWLGALFALVALILPPVYKTLGLAIWSSIQVLIYSAGPEIIGLALKDTDPTSERYRRVTQIALAVIIPVGYWVAGIGLLFAANLLKKDLDPQAASHRKVSKRKKVGTVIFLILLCSLVIALFVSSLVYKV